MMINYETKLKLKDLFLCLSEEEVRIERLRQVLASIPEFEPYAAFKRIDRNSTGALTPKAICKYLRENGYRELDADDIVYMVRYFDQDEDMKLSFHDFLQILLPCDNAVLRADVAQRPTFRIGKDENLPVRVEQSLTTLLLREVKLQIKSENIRRLLESQYDFNIQAAYKVIDDWNYGYLDARNLRRFMRNMGVLLSKQELVALIRRIDLDGDAKISYEEFFEGVKSQFSQINKIGQGVKAKGILSTHNGNTSQMLKGPSRYELIQASSASRKTPAKKNSNAKLVNPKFQPCRRTKSAEKTARRSKELARSIVSQECQCKNHHHHIEPEQSPQRFSERRYLNEDLESSSPNRLNKSVTFNQNVRVREYDSIHNAAAARLQASRIYHECSPQRAVEQTTVYNSSSINQSPLRNKASSFDQPRESFSSPDRYQQQNQRQESYHSPMCNKRTSPLKLACPHNQNSPQRTPILYNYVPVEMNQLKEELDSINRFDRFEQEECHKMIKDIIFLEREQETMKIELALKPDFNLLDAFKTIDIQQKGWVSFQELSETLNRYQEIDTFSLQGMQNMQLFFKRYDTNKDGKLSLAEFCKAFTPIGKEYATLVQGRAEFYAKKGLHPTEYFNQETRRELRNLWLAMLQTERSIEHVRQRMAKRQQFSMRLAFKYCDKDGNGAITASDFRDMLAEHGFYATEKELALVMNKFDKFADQKITMTDFTDEMAPKTA